MYLHIYDMCVYVDICMCMYTYITADALHITSHGNDMFGICTDIVWLVIFSALAELVDISNKKVDIVIEHIPKFQCNIDVFFFPNAFYL